jgi:hypothetical protein
MSDEQKPANETKPVPAPGLVVNNGPTLLTLIVAFSVSSLVTAGLAVGGFAWMRSGTTPATPQTPVTIEQPPAKPLVFTTTDTDVLKDGKKLSDEKAKPVIDVANLGDGEYIVRFSPVGENEVYRKVIVSGGTAPRPPPTDPVKPKPDTPVTPPVDPNTKVTAVTYVYEKDQSGIPNHVSTALNKINRDSGFKIVATIFEDDSTNGPGNVPAQYKAAYEAAKKEGLPVVVVTAGGKVVRSVKAPKTEQEILEAAK